MIIENLKNNKVSKIFNKVNKVEVKNILQQYKNIQIYQDNNTLTKQKLEGKDIQFNNNLPKIKNLKNKT